MGGVVVKWTDAEIAIVREHYPAGGYKACAPLLPGRSRGGIEQCAFREGATRYELGKNRAKEPNEAWGNEQSAPAHRAWQAVDRRMSSTPAANGPRYLIGAMG